MKNPWIMLVAGIAGGIGLVVACQHAGTPASASPGDCAVWQYTDGRVSTASTQVQLAPGQFGLVTVHDAPPGWEPVGSDGGSGYLRRCKP